MLTDMIICVLRAATSLSTKMYLFVIALSVSGLLGMMLVKRESSGRTSGYICQDAGKGHASGARDVVPAGSVAPQ